MNEQDRLSHCESLLSKGDPESAIIELMYLLKQEGQDYGRAIPLVNSASEACQNDYPRTRAAILDVMQRTESADVLDACLHAFIHFEDVATLKSCSAEEINIDPSHFYLGFEDYVDHCLMFAATQGKYVSLGQTIVEGAHFEAFAIHGTFLALTRAEGDSTTPVYTVRRRVEFDAPLFAVVHDRRNRRYLATLKNVDRIAVVNSETLETEHQLESPAPGVRGICIHEGLNRGFFSAEFGDVAFSFDLDGLGIRKTIEGFPKRPERIYLAPQTDTMVVSTLGEFILFPNGPIDGAHESVATAKPRGRVSQTVTLMNAKSESVTQTLTVGRRPTAVAISGKYIAAGNFFDNTVTIYRRDRLDEPVTIDIGMIPDSTFEFNLVDKQTKRNITISKVLRPRLVDGTAILDKRGWILLTGFDAGIVTIVDIEAKKATKVIPVQSRPFDVVVDEDEKYAFVSCHASDVVSVIDLDTQEEVLLLETGPSPVDMSLSDGQLLVADSTGFSIYEVNQLPL